MNLIQVKDININPSILDQIDTKSKSIYRTITFCKKTSSKSLLDSFINSTNSLTELLSIKNAQMEAESEEEVKVFKRNLTKTILFIINQIEKEINFSSEVQLFHIFRLISPESHLKIPNHYRKTHVQIGNFICPKPEELNSLIAQLFWNLKEIKHPLIKAIYLHHELIRIHPFVDGNGRTTRIAKNWILMYNLYPPIMIKDAIDKKEYITSLNQSFNTLIRNNTSWNQHTEHFFMRELARVSISIDYIINEIKKI